MSGLVERIARVLARQDSMIDPGPKWLDENWPLFEPNARDIIAAMREPTGAMYDAGDEHVGFQGDSGNAEYVWQAMIDAALKDA